MLARSALPLIVSGRLDFIGNWLWRATTYAQLGQKKQARAMVKQILERAPETTVASNFIKIEDPALMEKFRDGLRKAGLPE